MKSLHRILAVLYKELLQLGRDRLTFGMIIGIPLMQMLLFGFAINTDIRNLQAAYVDLSNTSASRQLVAEIQASQIVGFNTILSSSEQLQQGIRSGDINIGVYIPADFERRLQQPDRALAQVLVNGSDPTVVSVANQIAMFPFESRTGSVVSLAPRPIEVRVFYNPERRSSIFIVPGLIGVILTFTMILFTAVAIVRERERGNLELLITTPVANLELMVGKVVPYVIIGLIQTSIILVLGKWLFGLPIRGDLFDFYIAALAFIAASLTLGLMISTVTKSQFQAMQMTMFVLLPSILLSGFMFPFEGMPWAAQWIAETLPLTHFIRLSRGILLRGAELLELWDQLLILIGFAILALAIATRRFSKQLD